MCKIWDLQDAWQHTKVYMYKIEDMIDKKYGISMILSLRW
jgi:hypothetical protein